MTDLEHQHFTGASMGVTHADMRMMRDAPGKLHFTCAVYGRKSQTEITIRTMREALSVIMFGPETLDSCRVAKHNPTPLDWGIFQTYNNLIKW